MKMAPPLPEDGASSIRDDRSPDPLLAKERKGAPAVSMNEKNRHLIATWGGWITAQQAGSGMIAPVPA